MIRNHSKYGNRKTVVDGVTFDSVVEARHFSGLKLRERAGEITELRHNVPFELAPAVLFDGSVKRKPALTYRADATFYEKGIFKVQDIKGKTAPLTREFQIKRHLMAALLGLQIEIVRL